MVAFTRKEARDWAFENVKGVHNVVLPSYSADLKRLNEKGIRHDIRREIELGFSGTLLVSETAITIEQYEQFCEWAFDEAKGKLMLVFHAAFNTLEDNIEAAKRAEAAGCELVLLSYPPNFYPRTSQDVYDYTKAFCDSTGMAVLLFPVPHWGFDRLHPADIEVAMLRRMVDDIPNVVAIKAEGGMPSIQSYIECHRLFGKEVIISCPLENEMIPLGQLIPMQYSGTSNTEYMGDAIPRAMKLLQEGKFDEVSKLYWQIQPARKANSMANANIPLTLFIHRMVWKYQAWLNGFNGGPLPQPTMRLNDRMMNALRKGLVDSGFPAVELTNADYFVGRNPC
jgi:4-hydroxy-tetrahydrodipicolinate synthase